MPGPAAAGIPGLLAGYALRTTAVLVLALLFAAAAGKRPAAFRHFILSSALIGLLLLPALTLVPLGWHSRLLPAWLARPAAFETGGGAPAAGRLNAADVTASKSGLGLPGEGRGSEGSRALATGLPIGGAAAVTAAASVRPAASTLEPASRTASDGPPVPARGPRSGAVGLLVALLWATGSAALLARLSFGLAGAGRLTAEGAPLDTPAWRALLVRFLDVVSFRREVSLKSHPEVLVPLTCGWRKPTVLFPEGADAWSDDERSSALFHELSHVRRADFLVLLLVRASLALFWWNPLCWIVCREIQKEQEIACDELVLRAGIRPSTYAAALLAFRRSAGLRWSLSTALLGMLGRSSFQDRLAAILKQKLTLVEVKMKTKIMLALALVLAVAVIGTARPVSATVEAEATLPSPTLVTIDAPAGGPAQAEQAVARETEQEKAKAAAKAKKAEEAKAAEKAVREKAAAAKTIVVKPVTVEGKPIEVVITEGDQVKTIVIEKPLTITKGKDGATLVLTVDGKELEVLKGEPLRLEIKGGELKVLKEGQTLKIGDDKVFSIVKKGDREGEAVYFIGKTEPEIAVAKIKAAEEAEAAEEAAAAEATGQVFVKVRGDLKEGENWVAARAKTPRAVEVAREKAAKADVWIAQGRPAAWSMVDDGMLERIQALQEQVQAIKAKTMDITALEDSLKKLAAELEAREEKLKELKLKVEKVQAGAAVVQKGQPGRGATTRVMIGSDDKDDGTINLVFTGQDGEAGQLAFERALVALKKALPDGAKIVEQKYDAESGAMTFKIALPEGRKADETLVRKLVDRGREAIKTGK